MPSTTPIRRVVSIGADSALYKEGAASEAITPGHVVQLTSTGTVKKNDVTGLAPILVAVENDIYGKGRDDAYATNDQVIYQHLRSGCEFDGWVSAGAAAIVVDDYITLAANGEVIKGLQATAIGRAREAVDNSGGGTAVRLLVAVN